LGKALSFLNDGNALSEEQLAKAKKTLFGETKQTNQNNDAYMPDGSTSTKSGSDQNQNQDSSVPIREAVKKGDVDGVLDEMFKDLMA